MIVGQGLANIDGNNKMWKAPCGVWYNAIKYQTACWMVSVIYRLNNMLNQMHNQNKRDVKVILSYKSLYFVWLNIYHTVVEICKGSSLQSIFAILGCSTWGAHRITCFNGSCKYIYKSFYQYNTICLSTYLSVFAFYVLVLLTIWNVIMFSFLKCVVGLWFFILPF